MAAKGLGPADIKVGLEAVFGHAGQDLATPEFEWALQDLPLLTSQQLQQARAGCADTTLCVAVHLLDACRARLQGQGTFKRVQAWLLARQHSYAVVRLIAGVLQSEMNEEEAVMVPVETL